MKGPAEEDVERDREPDREPGDRLEGAARVGRRREDHPDEEEGQDRLDQERRSGSDAAPDRGAPRLDRISELIRERARDEERPEDGAPRNCATQ